MTDKVHGRRSREIQIAFTRGIQDVDSFAADSCGKRFAKGTAEDSRGGNFEMCHSLGHGRIIKSERRCCQNLVPVRTGIWLNSTRLGARDHSWRRWLSPTDRRWKG